MKYETLEAWLTTWNRLLDDPSELLLGKNFVNAVQAVLAEPQLDPNQTVERSQSPDANWKRKLFGILEETFDADALTIEYLRAEHPADVAVLQTLLHDPLGFNIGQIVQGLSNISGAPSLTLLRKELHRELFREPLDSERLTALLKLLLRYYVTKSSARTLAELPKTVVTRLGTAFFLKKILRKLFEDKSLNDELDSSLRDFLDKDVTEERIAGQLKKEPTSIFGIFDDGLWWNLSYGLVADLAKHLAPVLREQADKGDAAPPPTLLQRDEGALKELGLFVIENYTRAFIRRVLSELGRANAHERDSTIKKLGLLLGDFLVNTASFAHDWGRRPSTLDHLSAEAAAQATAKTLPATATKRIIRGDDDPLALAIGTLVVGAFNDDATEGVEWDSVNDAELASLCANALARRRIHEELGTLLKDFNQQLPRRLKLAISAHKERATPESLLAAQQFWEEWIESFSLGTGTYKTVFDLLPWSTLTDGEFSQLLDGVLDSALQPQESWLVNFKVHQIMPQGTLWKMGNVIFYDPSVYDFGEGRWLVKSSTEKNEAVIFAKVAVTADTSADAVRAARRNLDDALNVLSFERSTGVKAGGLNPEVHRNSYVVNVSTGKWTGGWELTPAEMPTEHAALGSELTSVAGSYDHLLDLSVRQPDSLSELQAGFLRAVYWYRKGRWEADATEKFSFYWIALEHLVVRDKVVELPYILSKLHVTWRDVSGKRIMWRNLPTLGQLEGWREEAVKRIKNDAALHANVGASPDLQGWETDPLLLLRLEKLEAIVPLVPDASEHKRFFTEYRDDFREIEGNKNMIAQRVDSKRAEVWFKVRLLYRLRNQLFHEALTSRAGIEVYAMTLEGLLEDTLKKMVGDVTTSTPRCRTMEQLVDWHQSPWM